MNDGDFSVQEDSLERARADVEIIQSCYPDEIVASSACDESSSFPFKFTLRLDGDSNINSCLTLKLDEGYPVDSGVTISNYRTDRPDHKARLEAVVRAVRRVSSECRQDEMEGCIACCAIALETWNDWEPDCDDATTTTTTTTTTSDESESASASATTEGSESAAAGASATTSGTAPTKKHVWVTGEPLFDRKSSFVAHVCEVHSERDVKEALYQLLTSSSKIQRATHNMYAWRIAERMPPDGNGDGDEQPPRRVVIKHDNDDDGEDAAGGKLAFLLDMRKDENVLVVVSRWYGGVLLGPKRFAHIVNVARELLVEYTSSSTKR